MQFQLPKNPNLEHFKKQAKKLLIKAKAGEFEVQGLSTDSKLSDAQHFLAKEYGFSSWSSLRDSVASTSDSPMNKAIQDLKDKKMCILFDDESRENEGDFVVAAEYITPDHLNFMSKFGRGTICVALSADLATKKGIGVLKKNPDSNDTPNFGHSLDLSTTHTGVSAFEKAETIGHLMKDDAGISDFRTPGHVFTLVGLSGGLSQRKGHTEGSLELVKRAGLKGGAVICEILKDDGNMCRYPDLEHLADSHQMQLVKMADL